MICAMVRDLAQFVASLVLFVAWGVVGFFGSFAMLYGFTPVGPVILLVVWLAYKGMPQISGRRTPEAFGALGGLGAFWLFVSGSVGGDPTFSAIGMFALGASVSAWLVSGSRRCHGALAGG